MTNVFQKINRRRFLQLTLSSGIAVVAVSTFKNNPLNSDGLGKLPQDLKNEIREYNSYRKKQLRTNLHNEILEDYKNQKTFWLRGELFTYAEVSKR